MCERAGERVHDERQEQRRAELDLVRIGLIWAVYTRHMRGFKQKPISIREAAGLCRLANQSIDVCGTIVQSCAWCAYNRDRSPTCDRIVPYIVPVGTAAAVCTQFHTLIAAPVYHYCCEGGPFLSVYRTCRWEERGGCAAPAQQCAKVRAARTPDEA